MTHFLEIVRFQVYAQLKAEAARGFLGILWWIIEPVLFMSVLYAVFTLGFRGGGDRDFIPFLLCGLMAWKWFATTVNQGGRSIMTNSSLMSQIYLPKWIFPSVIVLTNTIKFALAMAVLLLFLLIYGSPLHPSWAALPLVMAVQLLLIAAVAGAVSSLVPFFPDLLLLVETGLMFLFFISGIFFDVRSLPGDTGALFLLNPVALLVESYRRILLDGVHPDWTGLAVVVVLSAAVGWAAYLVLKRFDCDYPKLVP